jgi:hypothetical protein
MARVMKVMKISIKVMGERDGGVRKLFGKRSQWEPSVRPSTETAAEGPLGSRARGTWGAGQVAQHRCGKLRTGGRVWQSLCGGLCGKGEGREEVVRCV